MKCPECNKTGFNDPRHLGRHRRFAHNVIGKKHFKKDGVTPRQSVTAPEEFSCPECGEKYKSSLGVSIHRSAAHGVAGRTAKYNKKKVAIIHVDAKPVRPPAQRSPNGFSLQYIGHIVGYLEGICHQEAYKNNLPAKLFTQDVAEYFLAKTKIGG